jgi:hypothetical protein
VEFGWGDARYKLQDGEMERWRDGEMARWRDGELQTTKSSTAWGKLLFFQAKDD